MATETDRGKPNGRHDERQGVEKRVNEDDKAQRKEFQGDALSGLHFARMRKKVQKVMPLGALLLCGKDTYVARYQHIFGRPPRWIQRICRMHPGP
jgi:hypothetical protein